MTTHKTRQELEASAAVIPLARSEKFDLWIKALRQLPAGTRLSSLLRTEYANVTDRSQIRAANSPLDVAANDPLLRAAGLTGDTYGEGMRFFESNDEQMHRALCYCHYGETMDVETAIGRVTAMRDGRSGA